MEIKSGQNIENTDDGTARKLKVNTNGKTIFKIEKEGVLTVATSSNDNSLLTFDGNKATMSYTIMFLNEGTLNWENGTLQNTKQESTPFSGPIHVKGKNAKMHLKNGLFQNNEVGYFGGVITVNESGSFVMDGGLITNNELLSSHGWGAPVWISAYKTLEENNTTFEMNGGTISNNKAKYAGGIFIGTTELSDEYVRLKH